MTRSGRCCNFHIQERIRFFVFLYSALLSFCVSFLLHLSSGIQLRIIFLNEHDYLKLHLIAYIHLA